MTSKGLIDVFDLRSRLRFNVDSGHIWLDESRMLLLHTRAFGALRKELFDSLGVERARGLLVRMGFVSGQRDAELAKKLVGDGTIKDVFLIGPELHMLEGVVKVSAIDFDVDIEAGTFSGEFIWEESWEAESHLQLFGPTDDFACWSQIGYASGYVTAFLNKLVIFKEVACSACGSAACRIVGKLAEDWNDPEYLHYFKPENIVGQLLQLQEEVAQLRASFSKEHAQGDLIGVSDSFKKAFYLLEKACTSTINVLLLGETGVGKERFARWLHDHSPRADKPFIAINCAAIPNELIESELFGAQKGAYTGSQSSRSGRFERAHGGTLFLDEIGDLSLSAQVKLLRVLQTGEVERLGDDQVRKVDVRLVAATNVNLPDAIARGLFRADLYYRLSTYPVTIPPLRDRKLDLPLLIQALIDKYRVLYHKPLAGISDRALQALSKYSWPGNIRELENVIERGVLLVEPGGMIELEQLFANFSLLDESDEKVHPAGYLCKEKSEVGLLPSANIADTLLSAPFDLATHEQELLQLAVSRANGNLAKAARMLGLTRRQLAYRLSRKAD